MKLMVRRCYDPNHKQIMQCRKTICEQCDVAENDVKEDVLNTNDSSLHIAIKYHTEKLVEKKIYDNQKQLKPLQR